MVYNCRANLPEERHRNWTIATSGQWSKPTPTLTQETKREREGAKGRDGGREGFHTNHLTSQQELPAFHMKHTFLPLIPMKSCRKRLLQRGKRRKWCGTATGAITENPSLHPGYSFGVLPLWKYTLTPGWISQSEETVSSYFFSLCLVSREV